MRKLLILVALACMGCEAEPPSLWTTYNASVQHVYFQRDDQILRHDRTALTGHVEAEVRAGRPVPPGMAAQLGYLHYLAGDTAAAKKYFELESRLYPESERFMDDLIRRL